MIEYKFIYDGLLFRGHLVGSQGKTISIKLFCTKNKKWRAETWVLDSVYHGSCFLENYHKQTRLKMRIPLRFPWKSAINTPLLKMLMGLILLFHLLIFDSPHPTPVSPKTLEIDLQVLGGGSTASSMLWCLCIIGEDEILHVIYMVPSIISMFELKILSLT